jgi:hypothetical protein
MQQQQELLWVLCRCGVSADCSAALVSLGSSFDIHTLPRLSLVVEKEAETETTGKIQQAPISSACDIGDYNNIDAAAVQHAFLVHLRGLGVTSDDDGLRLLRWAKLVAQQQQKDVESKKKEAQQQQQQRQQRQQQQQQQRRVKSEGLRRRRQQEGCTGQLGGAQSKGGEDTELKEEEEEDEESDDGEESEENGASNEEGRGLGGVPVVGAVVALFASLMVPARQWLQQVLFEKLGISIGSKKPKKRLLHRPPLHLRMGPAAEIAAADADPAATAGPARTWRRSMKKSKETSTTGRTKAMLAAALVVVVGLALFLGYSGHGSVAGLQSKEGDHLKRGAEETRPRRTRTKRKRRSSA